MLDARDLCALYLTLIKDDLPPIVCSLQLIEEAVEIKIKNNVIYHLWIIPKVHHHILTLNFKQIQFAFLTQNYYSEHFHKFLLQFLIEDFIKRSSETKQVKDQNM